MREKWFGLKAVVAGAALLATGFAAPQAQAASQDILIGGGSVTGVYYQVALQTCSIMGKKSGGKYNCVGRPSLGSVFNVNAANRGLLDFGVVQSDRNWQAYNGSADWKGKAVTALRSVFSVHPETVLLVTRKDTGIKKVADLKGKRVNIGNPGSGQRGNAEDVLRIYGIDKDKDIKAEGLQQSEASRALVDRKIDAFFYTVGHPSGAIKEATAGVRKVHFVPIVDTEGLLAKYPYYAAATIPVKHYPSARNEEDVPTFGVKATLVTSAKVPDDVVYAITKEVFENLEAFREVHPAYEGLTKESMLEGLSAPLHPGALRYYQEAGLK